MAGDGSSSSTSVHLEGDETAEVTQILSHWLLDSVRNNSTWFPPAEAPTGAPPVVNLSDEVKKAIGAYMDQWLNEVYPGDTDLGDPQGVEEFNSAGIADLMAHLEPLLDGAAVDRGAVLQCAGTCLMEKKKARAEAAAARNNKDPQGPTTQANAPQARDGPAPGPAGAGAAAVDAGATAEAAATGCLAVRDPRTGGEEKRTIVLISFRKGIDTAKALVERHGGEVKKRQQVSKTTAILVNGGRGGNSAAAISKANEHDVPVMGIRAFKELIDDGSFAKLSLISDLSQWRQGVRNSYHKLDQV